MREGGGAVKYLLDEEEFQSYRKRDTSGTTEEKRRALLAARGFILRVANFQCYAEVFESRGVCDNCPVVEAATMAGEGLEGRFATLHHLCTLPKRWSK